MRDWTSFALMALPAVGIVTGAAASTAAQDKMSKEQCSELLRILANKRKRLDSMTEGEKADHARSEENYLARCKSN